MAIVRKQSNAEVINVEMPKTKSEIVENVEMQPVKTEPSKPEVSKNVSEPSHYVDGRKYEPRKVIHDWGLNFNLGNAVKYISRAGRKGDMLTDLMKAKQYIEFEIEELQSGAHEEPENTSTSVTLPTSDSKTPTSGILPTPEELDALIEKYYRQKSDAQKGS